ncbi:hypothetical protein HMPREF9220_0548 [Dialister micraerophilus UPII 345-E]|uniref:Uncharacterized protein n=1 Tax=Dialister micraerophilus UPII 345-E TaxID=910314 RepID=E4L8Z3_9FIRM|nr:hypothetical protein HMPREF9220_0548 [Dialister micraerophilus UPII 345-E]
MGHFQNLLRPRVSISLSLTDLNRSEHFALGHSVPHPFYTTPISDEKTKQGPHTINLAFLSVNLFLQNKIHYKRIFYHHDKYMSTSRIN